VNTKSLAIGYATGQQKLVICRETVVALTTLVHDRRQLSNPDNGISFEDLMKLKGQLIHPPDMLQRLLDELDVDES